MFGWYGYHQHVYMIWHQMSFMYLTFLLPCQFVEYGPQFFSYVSKDCFPSSFWYKHHMVFAVPTWMWETLIEIRHGIVFLKEGFLIKPPLTQYYVCSWGFKERSNLFWSHHSKWWLTFWDFWELKKENSCWLCQRAALLKVNLIKRYTWLYLFSYHCIFSTKLSLKSLYLQTKNLFFAYK